jgi:hypothetical protein
MPFAWRKIEGENPTPLIIASDLANIRTKYLLNKNYSIIATPTCLVTLVSSDLCTIHILFRNKCQCKVLCNNEKLPHNLDELLCP